MGEMTLLVRLAIDFENPARVWWENGGRDLWESVTEAFDTSSVVIEESLARSWLAEAEKIEGWEDGPDYAPHPVSLRELEPDEQV